MDSHSFGVWNMTLEVFDWLKYQVYLQGIIYNNIQTLNLCWIVLNIYILPSVGMSVRKD